jgi:hypothetical protein
MNFNLNYIFEILYLYIKNINNNTDIQNIKDIETGHINMDFQNDFQNNIIQNDFQNNIIQNDFQNKYSNRIKLSGSLNNSFQMSFLKQYSNFKHSDDIYIEITTNGGDYHIAYMIAQIIQKHKGNTTILVPYHILSYGSIIALSANNIILSHIGCLGTISNNVDIQKDLTYIDIETYNNAVSIYDDADERRRMCCGIREYLSAFTRFLNYIQRMIQKIRFDKMDLIDKILDKYEKINEIKGRIMINSHYSNPLHIKELSELGLNINVDPELISNLFSKPMDEIDESCENMKNTIGRISNSREQSSSTSGSMSNLISLITQKIDADTK